MSDRKTNDNKSKKQQNILSFWNDTVLEYDLKQNLKHDEFIDDIPSEMLYEDYDDSPKNWKPYNKLTKQELQRFDNEVEDLKSKLHILGPRVIKHPTAFPTTKRNHAYHPHIEIPFKKYEAYRPSPIMRREVSALSQKETDYLNKMNWRETFDEIIRPHVRRGSYITTFKAIQKEICDKCDIELHFIEKSSANDGKYFICFKMDDSCYIHGCLVCTVKTRPKDLEKERRLIIHEKPEIYETFHENEISISGYFYFSCGCLEME